MSMSANFVFPAGDLLQLSELMRVAVSHLRAEAERWENVRECLRMAASTIPLVDRTVPTRLAAALMAAETPGVPLDGKEVRCTVSTHEGWSTLAAQPALHAQEMASAMDSLAALCPHLREAGLEGLLGWVEDSIVKFYSWPLEGAYKGNHEVYVTMAGRGVRGLSADVRALQSWMWDVRGTDVRGTKVDRIFCPRVSARQEDVGTLSTGCPQCPRIEKATPRPMFAPFDAPSCNFVRWANTCLCFCSFWLYKSVAGRVFKCRRVPWSS